MNREKVNNFLENQEYNLVRRQHLREKKAILAQDKKV